MNSFLILILILVIFGSMICFVTYVHKEKNVLKFLDIKIPDTNSYQQLLNTEIQALFMRTWNGLSHRALFLVCDIDGTLLFKIKRKTVDWVFYDAFSNELFRLNWMTKKVTIDNQEVSVKYEPPYIQVSYNQYHLKGCGTEVIGYEDKKKVFANYNHSGVQGVLDVHLYEKIDYKIVILLLMTYMKATDEIRPSK